MADLEAEPQRASTRLSLGLAKFKVRQCQRSGGEDCNAGIPIIFYGSDVIDVTMNIYSAMMENGSSPVLQRISPTNSRSWLRSPAITNGECIGTTGGTTGNECDEYPFSSARQGGVGNYSRGSVRIAPVRRSQNRRAGAKLEGFGGLYRTCGVRANDPIKGWFGVIPIPAGQTRVQCVSD